MKKFVKVDPTLAGAVTKDAAYEEIREEFFQAELAKQGGQVLNHTHVAVVEKYRDGGHNSRSPFHTTHGR